MAKQLTSVKSGNKYKVVSVNGSKHLIDSLANYGIVPGVEVNYDDKIGSIYVIYCKGIKYGFDKQTTKAIEVE